MADSWAVLDNSISPVYARSRQLATSNPNDPLVLIAGGTRLVSASYDHTVRLWDLPGAAELARLEQHHSIIEDLAVAPNESFTVSASLDGLLLVWGMRRGTRPRSLRGHAEAASRVAVSPDSSFIISAGQNEAGLRVWEVASARTVDIVQSEFTSVGRIDLLANGLALVASDNPWDARIEVWDWQRRTLQRTLKGHTDRITDVWATRDGQQAISSSADHSLRLWDLTNGAMIARFEADGGLSCCALADDGANIVAGEEAGRLHFLRLEEPFTEVAGSSAGE
jgi:WD40 repeat protein